MKKYLLSAIIASGFITPLSTHAASYYGIGCNTWGPVSYLYTAENGVLMAIVNGGACVVTNINDRSAVSSAAAILSEAQTSGKNAIVLISGQGSELTVALNN